MDLEKINQRVEAGWRQRIADEAGETPEAGAGENGDATESAEPDSTPQR